MTGLDMLEKEEKIWNKFMSFLRIVATPIGNLEDVTLRALRVLKESDFILCEDTRVTKKLLGHYQIKTPTISYHQHSGDLKIDKIVSLLMNNNNLALVSDAGTPGISDPGGKLVSLIREQLKDKVVIESIPGASALGAAVSISGGGFDRFLFLWFLPHKKGRQTKLKEIKQSVYPVVLYESKHRLKKLIEELNDFSKGDSWNISVARELTKIHESFCNGSAQELLAAIEFGALNIKGEFVILIKK